MGAAVQPSPGPFYTVLIIYLGVMAFIGWYASRKTSSLGDFFVLSGKAGAIVSGIAYFSTQFSMGTFLGTAGMLVSATLIEWAGVNGIASIQGIEKADQIVPLIL